VQIETDYVVLFGNELQNKILRLAFNELLVMSDSVLKLDVRIVGRGNQGKVHILLLSSLEFLDN